MQTLNRSSGSWGSRLRGRLLGQALQARGAGGGHGGDRGLDLSCLPVSALGSRPPPIGFGQEQRQALKSLEGGV